MTENAMTATPTAAPLSINAAFDGGNIRVVAVEGLMPRVAAEERG